MTLVTPAIYRAKLAEHLGYQYGFADRCGGSWHQHDCSGYMCWAMNETGLTHDLCTSSFVLAQQCWDLGLRIGEDEARNTDGVWAFRGADFGRRTRGAVNGSDGHIVACYLPSTGGTYEAMGRRYGVVQGAFDGRGWTGFYKIPGMYYGTVPTPQSTRERDMILQSGRPSNVAGQDAYVIVAPDGKNIQCWNGASLANDQPTGSPRLRIWTPVALGSNKIIGATLRPADKEDSHAGIAVADDSGKMHRGHWS